MVQAIDTNLFGAIQKSLESQEPITGAYYKKHLMYKQFKFQKENTEDLTDMLAKIQDLLTANKKEHFLLLEKKMLEAQDALIKECEKIYSERINYNQELQDLVQFTIVPYYHGRFQISLSREISFLPLELRLYIYTALLHIEASTIRQMHLMDRIALTLHKSGENLLGDVAIFISSWLKTKLSKVTFGTKKSFLPLYELEVKNTHEAASLRERILTDAEMTPKVAGREFWYGLKSFSSYASIHNFEVVKLCLNLFVSYYKGSFAIAEELQPVLHQCYKTKNFKEINRYLEKEGLNEVSIIKRYNQAVYNTQSIKELSSADVEKIDNAQKSYVQKNIKHHKENRYLYLNPTKEKVSDENLKVPEVLSEFEAAIHIEKLSRIIRFKRIRLSDFDDYILKISTSITCSDVWDLEKLNIVVGLLAEIYSLVWLRSNQSEKDMISLFEILLKILKEEKSLEMYSQGKGWPVALIVEESNNTQKRFLIIKSSDKSLPYFIGHLYLAGNPLDVNLKQLEIIVQTNVDIRLYWQRLERKVGLSKSNLRKRNNMWKKLREAQEKKCFQV